jgi:hypothetical protein
MRIRSSFLLPFLLFGLVLIPASAAHGGTICLAWDPAPGATGYKVYYGTSPGQYTGIEDVKASTQVDLDGLQDCTTYYLAVKAYNHQGESSSFSNEVSGWPRPQLTSLVPGEFTQGEQVTVDLNGANFQQGAELLIDLSSIPTDASDRPLVSLENIAVLSCNRIQALITVEPTARGLRAMEVGEFSLQMEVRNPDTVFGARSEPLEVVFDASRADINRSDSTTTDRVDGKDLSWLTYAHGSVEGEAYYNPDADLDGNGQVDGVDLSWLAARFGQCRNGAGWSESACD